jgi:hypothetical protein
MKRYEVCNGNDEAVFVTDSYVEALDEFDNLIEEDPLAYIWDAIMEEVVDDFFGESF